MSSLTDGVLRNICRQGPILAIVFAGLCVALVLTLVSAVVVDPGSATYAVVVLNIVGIIPLTLLVGGILWKCSKME